MRRFYRVGARGGGAICEAFLQGGRERERERERSGIFPKLFNPGPAFPRFSVPEFPPPLGNPQLGAQDGDSPFGPKVSDRGFRLRSTRRHALTWSPIIGLVPLNGTEHVEAITVRDSRSVNHGAHGGARSVCRVCPSGVRRTWCFFGAFALVFGCVNFIPRGFVVVVMHRSERSAPADPQSGGSPPRRA